MGTEAWIWMAVWVIGMVFVVWLLVRDPSHRIHVDPGEILRARYARGEIREDEYKRAMAALDADPPAPRRKAVRDHASHQSPDGQEARHE